MENVPAPVAPEPAPAAAAAIPSPPPSPSGATRFRSAAERARALAKLRLLRVRYVLGFLAGSLLVSFPIDAGYQLGHGRETTEILGTAGLSVLYGLLCVGGFFALQPLTRVPWERVRVPEFSLFGMSVAGWSALVAASLLALSLFAGAFLPALTPWLPRRLFWTVLVLLTLAWAKTRVQVFLFPEFYADKGGEKILSPEVVP